MTSFLRALMQDMREKEAAFKAHLELSELEVDRRYRVPDGFTDLEAYNARSDELKEERDLARFLFSDRASKMLDEGTLVEKKVKK